MGRQEAFESILRNNHHQRTAQRHQEMSTESRILHPVFAVEPDDRSAKPRHTQTHDKIPLRFHIRIVLFNYTYRRSGRFLPSVLIQLRPDKLIQQPVEFIVVVPGNRHPKPFRDWRPACIRGTGRSLFQFDSQLRQLLPVAGPPLLRHFRIQDTAGIQFIVPEEYSFQF